MLPSPIAKVTPSSHVKNLKPETALTSFSVPKPPLPLFDKLSPRKSSVPESPFKVPTSTPIKRSGLKPDPPTPDDDDDDDDDKPQNISLSFGCPSPKLTPYKQSSVEKDLLDWAKKGLASYHQIKVTNLSSSWRNGLGYCALLYDTYSNLVPMKSLKMHNLKDNCELAFNVGQLVTFFALKFCS